MEYAHLDACNIRTNIRWLHVKWVCVRAWVWECWLRNRRLTDKLEESFPGDFFPQQTTPVIIHLVARVVYSFYIYKFDFFPAGGLMSFY